MTSSSITQKAIPFFRSPDSPFQSGQARLDLLKEFENQEIQSNYYIVKKDNKKFRLESDAVLRDLDLSYQVFEIKTGQQGIIKKSKPNEYLVEFADNSNKWLSSDEILPETTDLGLAVVIEEHPLRTQSQKKDDSSSLALIGEKFRVIGFENGFLRVKKLLNESPNDFYLEPSHTILKIDFANFVLNQDKTWMSFLSREKLLLNLTQKKSLDITEVRAFLTRPDLGVLIKSVDFGLVPRSTVVISKTNTTTWIESTLPQHGLVYWKKSELLDNKNETKKSTQLEIPTEEITKKQFYQLALHPQDPNEALVVSDGIFYTQNGLIWKKIEIFDKQNLPVQFGENGELYIGSFVSKNKGKDFVPYLRYEDLSRIIEKKFGKTPNHLRISEIKLIKKQIQLHIDAGSYSTWITGTNKYGLVTDWKF